MSIKQSRSVERPRRAQTTIDVRSLLTGIAGVAVVVSIAAAVLWSVWDDLPLRVATHWNGAGEPDAFSDRGRGLALTSLLVPAGAGVALAVLLAFVPRSAPGTRWISALPVGVTAGIAVVTVGSLVGQRGGDQAEVGVLVLLVFVVGLVATAAVVPLMASADAPPADDPPPADAPRLTIPDDAWWTGAARMSPRVVAGFVAMCVVPAVVLAATSRIGWIVGLVVLVPTALILAHSRFRVTVGGRQVVISGPVLGRPSLRVPVETIAEAGTRDVTFWEYGGLGLRYGSRGVGVITRRGEALVLHRTDGTEVTVTCDDAATAAATVNTLRSRPSRSRSCSSD